MIGLNKDEDQYEKKASLFLKNTKTKFSVKFLMYDRYFPDDEKPRDIYKITLTRNKEEYSFSFGQSIANKGIPPTPYDVLACLTKSNPGTFEDFCAGYGYNTDSRKAERIYDNVLEEWVNVQRIFDEESIKQLREIE